MAKRSAEVVEGDDGQPSSKKVLLTYTTPVRVWAKWACAADGATPAFPDFDLDQDNISFYNKDNSDPIFVPAGYTIVTAARTAHHIACGFSDFDKDGAFNSPENVKVSSFMRYSTHGKGFYHIWKIKVVWVEIDGAKKDWDVRHLEHRQEIMTHVEIGWLASLVMEYIVPSYLVLDYFSKRGEGDLILDFTGAYRLEEDDEPAPEPGPEEEAE